MPKIKLRHLTKSLRNFKLKSIAETNKYKDYPNKKIKQFNKISEFRWKNRNINKLLKN